MTFINSQVTLRLKQVAAAALLALGATTATAAGYAGTQFEIELVVFARDSGMNQTRETWPATPRLDYSERWVDFNTPSRSDPLVPVLEPAPNQLDNKVAALRRSAGYQVLFHKTWRQVLQNERNAPAILISGGTQDGDHHQLEGSVTLSVSRYLHLSADLWFSEWLPPSATLPALVSQATTGQTSPQGIPVPARPRAAVVVNAANDEPMDLDAGSIRTESAVFHNGSSFSDRPIAGEPASASISPSLEKLASRVAVLQEGRRLRSGELHYIDHPKLGVLVEVRTVAAQAEPELQDEPMEITP